MGLALPLQVVRSDRRRWGVGVQGDGLSPQQEAICDGFVYIPQYGPGTASLNVTVAASIVLHSFALWAGYQERAREGVKFVVAPRPERRARNRVAQVRSMMQGLGGSREKRTWRRYGVAVRVFERDPSIHTRSRPCKNATRPSSDERLQFGRERTRHSVASVVAADGCSVDVRGRGRRTRRRGGRSGRSSATGCAPAQRHRLSRVETG